MGSFLPRILHDQNILSTYPILPFIKTGPGTMMAGFEPVAMTALIFGGCCTNVFALENILK